MYKDDVFLNDMVVLVVKLTLNKPPITGRLKTLLTNR